MGTGLCYSHVFPLLPSAAVLMQLPEEDKRHCNNSPLMSATLVPKLRAGLSAVWSRLLFLSSHVRAMLLKFPAMDMGILGAKILLRNMAKTSDCISSYLGHSFKPQEYQSAVQCAGPVKGSSRCTVVWTAFCFKKASQSFSKASQKTMKKL